MLRLISVFSWIVVLAAPMGCAGSLSVLSRAANNEPASEDAEKSPNSSDSPRSVSQAEVPVSPRTDVASQSQREPSEPKAGAVDGDGAPVGQAEHRTSPASAPSAISSAGSDHLAQMVAEIDFDDPAEEAGALAALRAAPVAHREFLLRMLKASAGLRRSQAGGVALASRTLIDKPLAVTSEAASASGPSTEATISTSARPALTSAQNGSRFEAQSAAATDAILPRAEILEDGQKLSTAKREEAVQAAGDERSSEPGWRWRVDQAIKAVESELAGSSDTDRAILEARLRLLYLIAGRRDDAMRSTAAATVAQQEFWAKELYGLSILLDDNDEAIAAQRARRAVEPLREASERLGQAAGLVIKNLHFCNEVKGFGSFVGFSQDEFRPGQEVLLYCEIENFQSKLSDRGYHTALKGRYQIFDSSGNRVAEKDFGLKDEHCQNRRRDFFVPYFLWMPKQAPPGKYQLKLTLEDVHGATTADATIGFTIK